MSYFFEEIFEKDEEIRYNNRKYGTKGKREKRMEFIRIDETTVRCIVTEDDMREYDVEIDDFLKNRSKVQDFLHIIVERATDEVGYEPKDGLLAMQIMMLPRNRLAITFSEKMDSSNDLDDIIQQVAGATIEKVSSLKELFEEELTEKPEEKNKENVKKKVVKPLVQIFEFQSLADFEQFCNVLSDKHLGKSSLYKDVKSKLYYGVFEKGRLSKVNFNFVCRTASEYGRFLSDKQERRAYIEEHMDCLIAGKAVKVVRKMINASS